MSWYEEIKSTELRQGDFIPRLPFIPLPDNFIDEENLIRALKDAGKLVYYNVVILSQSCDLEYNKVKLVHVCPVWSLSALELMYPSFKNIEQKEALRRGYMPGLHLLDKASLFDKEDFYIVEFRSTFTVPIKFLKDFVKSINVRYRLRSPYCEHLSQAFARFFMRVGLPADIPKFADKVKPSSISEDFT